MLRPGVLLALLLASALLAAPPHAATAQTTEPTRATQAEVALAKVEGLFESQALTAGTATSPNAPDRSATMALRDLALLSDDLAPEQRERAASYLARPTASPGRCPDASCYRTKRVRRACSVVVCVHYVRKSDDRVNGVPRRDQDGDGRPDYVEKVLTSVTHVHRKYVDAGYRPPARDGRRGGDARTDIYLAQIGDWGLYGYCTTDPATAPDHGRTWAYCVLDNDYRKREFPLYTPIKNMKVTAAHEYFHAVQFGYDIGEDTWFMEATATWAEDEVYDRIDDNRGYLSNGPMGEPGLSLDWHRDRYWYGAWIFFRYVSERFRTSQAGLPVIVRTMWRKAGTSAPDLYSLQAVEEALAEQGTDIAAEYLQMAAANLHPRRWYDEGSRYPTAPLERAFVITPTSRERVAAIELDHLTSASYLIEPADGLSASDWQLRLILDLAPKVRGSRALARVFFHSGDVETTVLDLAGTGNYDGTVPFSATDVKAVELTVVNGSSRYNCEIGTRWTCHGRPLDQDLTQSIVARAQQPA
ncbi:MXAN_6640 family putative metalloprotease [Nocardioides antri]|uniref:Uncharacterized protein n=1 Tax=Nocardioides antri TaxID=2607659 RepID=A0A5B1LZI2_9ACTN|nr:MXAN_6640 family putative metalloprotease [Nocardioides antri]KAA1425856.1 hypothetical protein F0U47_16030 [Nocardioides antri]